MGFTSEKFTDISSLDLRGLGTGLLINATQIAGMAAWAGATLLGTANQVVITSTGGGTTLTFSTPQNIHTGASPTFAGLTLSGALTISAGGAAITGNSSVTGTFTTSSTLTVTAGGVKITAGGLLIGSASFASAGDKLETDGIIFCNAENSGLIVSASGGRGVGIVKTAGLNTEIRYDTASQLAIRRAITGGILAITTSDTPIIFDTSGNTLIGNDLKINTLGKGIYIKEGANATSGVATLVGGTVVVNTTKVTANSRIQLTHQNNSGTVGFVTVSARVAGTSFTILSSNALDTSDIGWVIVEPA